MQGQQYPKEIQRSRETWIAFQCTHGLGIENGGTEINSSWRDRQQHGVGRRDGVQR